MRKIAIIGGTGIYSPETLQCFEEKVIQTPYGAALCNIGTMCGNQVIFITRHGVGHKTAPHKVNYRANIWALKSLGTEEIFATTAVGSLNPDMEETTKEDLIWRNKFHGCSVVEGRWSRFW